MECWAAAVTVVTITIIFKQTRSFNVKISAYLLLKVNSDSKARMKCMGDLNPGSLQTDIYISDLQACPKEIRRRNRLLVSVLVSSGQRLECSARAE